MNLTSELPLAHCFFAGMLRIWIGKGAVDSGGQWENSGGGISERLQRDHLFIVRKGDATALLSSHTLPSQSESQGKNCESHKVRF